VLRINLSKIENYLPILLQPNYNLIMKLINLLCLMFFSSLVHSEWTPLDTNFSDNKYWYNQEEISIDNHDVYVWLKTRYSKPTKDNVNSNKIYLRIH